MNLNQVDIKLIRSELEILLKKYNKKEHIKLEIPVDILESIIFKTYLPDEKYPAIDFSLLKKIDLTGISFDNVFIRGLDFTGSYGVKINPQTVSHKSLDETILTDTEIIGPFDECSIEGTSFLGSKGAIINPGTIHTNSFMDTILTDALIIGTFAGCLIQGADFTGSHGALINPQELSSRSLRNCIFTDATFTAPLDDCYLEYTNFTGSKGAIINPQNIYDYSLRNNIFRDVTFEGIFDNCDISYSDFTGSKGGVVNIEKIERMILANLTDAKIIGDYENIGMRSFVPSDPDASAYAKDLIKTLRKTLTIDKEKGK